jgi:two-component system, OmpR family, response regulator
MSTAEGQCGPPLQILIVEDYPDAAESMRDLLAWDGYEICIAHCLQSAVSSVETSWPDVVLLDIAMPGGSGYEVAKRVRERCGSRRKPLFIAISGYATEADRLHSRAEGINLHFAKPVDPMFLREVLRSYANSRQTAPVP